MEVSQEGNVGRILDELAEILPLDAVHKFAQVFDLRLEHLISVLESFRQLREGS